MCLRRFFCLLSFLFGSLFPFGLSLVAAEPPLPQKVDFNRDVRPILSDNCYHCHGPDKSQRKADLRLDTREGLFSTIDDVHLVAAGKPAESELYQRLLTTDKKKRMPQAKSGKTLSQRQIAVIEKWIQQGAEWQGHWSYLPPARPEPPAASPAGPASNGVDRFVQAKLAEAGLKPSPEADRATLIRRLSFDLTGLPPGSEEVEAFVNDPRPDAYEKLLERLLASPHYGERMAEYWLDLVRYADSIGYHSDNPMQVALFRDYVIQAFNANKPFDRFTIEQLAGDLLPQATNEQKIASAYNRLLMTTEEGGAQPKEYEAKNAADRVRNVAAVWLGATMGCCQCHDHKFDPYTLKDFYRMAAFFADVKEASVGRREPGMLFPDQKQAAALQRLEAALAEATKKLEAATPEFLAAQAAWEKQLRMQAAKNKKTGNDDEWKTLDPVSITAAKGTTLTRQLDGSVLASGVIPDRETYTVTAKAGLQGITAFRLEALPHDAFPEKGPGTSPNGNFVLTELTVEAGGEGKPAQRVKLHKPFADFSQIDFPVDTAIDGRQYTGWGILPRVGKPHTAIFETVSPPDGNAETTLIFTLDHQSEYPQHNLGRFRLSATTSKDPSGRQGLPLNIREILALAPEKRNDKQKKELTVYYRSIAPLLAPLRQELADLKKNKAELIKVIPKTLVATAAKPRTVRMLARGNWLDDSGEIVEPGVPHFLKQPPVTQPRATRLDLARWIAARDNPLTARVLVNRLWKLFFGQGIAKTLDDLGAQGEWPTHPELLDWLAVEFMESGWDVKHVVRLLVTSSSYRQTSQVRPDLKERDPYNRLVGRQTRYRLDAEVVRDNALAVSGLLSRRIGGDSVKPYQPAGYWAALNFPVREWENDSGVNLYRRGLYTHWQRTFLHPSLVAFDAPSREECTVERSRSNIPQQALVLLNDPTYVEAARVFAERIVKESGPSLHDRLSWAYGLALSRKPRQEELKLLADLYSKHYRQYAEDKTAAQKLLTAGAYPAAKNENPAELAAWTSVARVILNLHETITRN